MMIAQSKHCQNFIQNHMKEDLRKMYFLQIFLDQGGLYKIYIRWVLHLYLNTGQSNTEGNGTCGDSHSLWTKARNRGQQGSFRQLNGLQRHWASPSTGVMTIIVHIVGSLSVAARLNFHYLEPDERSWVVSPGRRVSSDVVTLELRAPSAPCASFAVRLLQLLACRTQQSDSLLHLLFPLCGLLIRLYLSHVIRRCVAESQTLLLVSDLPSTSRLCAEYKQAYRVYSPSDAHQSFVSASRMVQLPSIYCIRRWGCHTTYVNLSSLLVVRFWLDSGMKKPDWSARDRIENKSWPNDNFVGLLKLFAFPKYMNR